MALKLRRKDKEEMVNIKHPNVGFAQFSPVTHNQTSLRHMPHHKNQLAET